MSSNKYPPLQLAAELSQRVNDAWADGSFLDSVTPITRNLLTYWFSQAYRDYRPVNFHEGQEQAIKNIIYLHEVLKVRCVTDIYERVDPSLLMARGMLSLDRLHDEIYNHPKYAVKMATGTGKTWVLEALLIWQYLNAKHNQPGDFTANFLVVAPGLIVYERLLDAFRGKLNNDGITRNPMTSDLYRMQDLFIPEEYRDEIFGFLNSSVLAKSDIGSSVTGEGMLAITNYHLLMQKEDKEAGGDSWALPVRPGIAAGNSLDVLDGAMGNDRALEYLRSLPDLMVINDEAHHIHSTQKSGELGEVEWQKSLRYIASGKQPQRYMQVDFSATPYIERNKSLIYFPHIVVDFDLKSAIQRGLVKTLALDERKELNTEDLDYKSVRDEPGRIVALSDGQRAMLRAGRAKLDKLAEDFTAVDVNHDKSPKMMVMCEETEVVPLVRDFLIGEGMAEDDIIEIHSNKKGEVGEEEWQQIKLKLSSLDKHARPRVVISVLMLREGFDVNNICVIVPLRSTQSKILLEQTVGRGLRLMWRGDSAVDEIKRHNLERIMVEHKKPEGWYDILSIVEHPAFRQFYDDLIADGVVADMPDDDPDSDDTLADLVSVGLKNGYERYDFYFPTIISEGEQVMAPLQLDVMTLRAYSQPLETLVRWVPKNEEWISSEVTKKVRIGDFNVSDGVFTATSYNDYLGRLVRRISDLLNSKTNSHAGTRSGRSWPALSVNAAKLAGVIDQYICTRLFNRVINPQDEAVFRVLKINDVIDHISGQVSGLIVAAQNDQELSGDTEVIETPLSSVNRITVRQGYSLELAKSIYERTPFPKNKGLFERDFLQFADLDGRVDAVAKIMENKHTFVRLRYVRSDGLPANYMPDFFVRMGGDVYMVETKAQNMVKEENVQRKKRAALRWVTQINALPAEKRRYLTWHYVILADDKFYEWQRRGASMYDLLSYFELRPSDEAHDVGRLF